MFYLFLAIIVIVGLSTTGALFSAIHIGNFHKNLEIEVGGLQPEDRNKLRVSFLQFQDDTTGSTDMLAVPSTRKKFCWNDSTLWVKEIHINATASALKKITDVKITSGGQEQSFSGNEVRQWKKLKPMPFLLPSDQSDTNEEIISLCAPMHAENALNLLPLDQLLTVCMEPSLIFLLIATVLLLSARQLLKREDYATIISKALTPRVGSDDPVNEQRVAKSRAKTYLFNPATVFVIGIAVLSAAYCIIQTIERRPFTQDDNYAQFLPVLLRSFETIQHGKFPTWSPYQFLGSPTTTVGTYALTYPVTYIAYFIAHSIFHDDFATLDVYSILHLCFGYAATFLALRQAKCEQWICVTGALSWVLSGWFFVAGRSQATFMPIAVMLPLAILSVNWLRTKQVGWRWAILTALALGLGFHGGHAELWLYTIMFYALAVVLSWLANEINWRRAIWAVVSLGMTAAIVAPLAILQFLETADTQRQTAFGWPINVPGALLPGITQQPPEMGLGSLNFERFPEMFYNGTLFTAVGLIALTLLVAILFFRRDMLSKRMISGNIWLLLGSFSFFASLGGQGVVYLILSFLPIFNKFRWSIKYTPFFQLFFIFAGAAIIERLFPDNKKLKICTFIAVTGLLLFHISLCNCTWYSYGDRDYPVLDSALTDTVLKEEPQRIYTPAPDRNIVHGYANSMALNFPTEYKIIDYGGYDTFISTKQKELFLLDKLYRNTSETRRALGIGWVIWPKICDELQLGPNPVEAAAEIPHPVRLELADRMRGAREATAHSDKIKVFKLDDPDPIVFETGTRKRLPYSLDQSGITADTSGLPASTSVTFNFIDWPWMRAKADNRDVPCKNDQWQRIVVDLNQPTRTLVVSYSPPWALSSGVGFAILLVSLGIGLFASRQSQTRKTDEASQ